MLRGGAVGHPGLVPFLYQLLLHLEKQQQRLQGFQTRRLLQRRMLCAQVFKSADVCTPCPRTAALQPMRWAERVHVVLHALQARRDARRP